MFGRRIQKSRIERRDPPSWKRGLIGALSVVFVASTLGLVAYVTRLPQVTLTTVTVSDGETVQGGDIRDRVMQVLSGTYFTIVPYTFAYTYPRAEVLEALTNHPRIKSAQVLWTDARTLTVTFTEYLPYALWCTEGSTSCYFIDETGYAFSEAPQLAGGSLVRIVDERVLELHETQAFAPVALKDLFTFIADLERVLSFRITEATYTRDGDLLLSVGGGGALYVTPKDTYSELLRRAELVLASRSFDHLQPGNFEYIDLRFGNKVFVQEVKPVSATTSTSTVIEEAE
jgi:hypothetical protein